MGRLLPHLDDVEVNEVADTSASVVLQASARSVEQSEAAGVLGGVRVH
jgi:hypothetical protein